VPPLTLCATIPKPGCSQKSFVNISHRIAMAEQRLFCRVTSLHCCNNVMIVACSSSFVVFGNQAPPAGASPSRNGCCDDTATALFWTVNTAVRPVMTMLPSDKTSLLRLRPLMVTLPLFVIFSGMLYIIARRRILLITALTLIIMVHLCTASHSIRAAGGEN